MTNRIEVGHSEIRKWKQEFEKLFSPDVIDSRAFRLEHLGMYERLLDRYKNLSRDETVFYKLVAQEKKNLERSLYPNPLIRLVRKVVRFGISAFRLASSLFASTAISHDQLRTDIQKAGFGELASLAQKRLAQGESSFKLEQTEATSEKERMNYSLIISQDRKGARMEGFEISYTAENGDNQKFRFDASERITKEQARELVHGRAINSYANTWRMIDFNDKDANGNFLLREFIVPDFDIARELDKLPLRRSTEANTTELLNGLRAGKKMACAVTVDGKVRSVEIEALPLKRGLAVYEGSKKVVLSKITTASEAKGQARELRVAHVQRGTRTNKIIK